MNKSEPTIERALPSNIEAEKSVLGAILLENKKIDEAMVLKPTDFFFDCNRRIFKQMVELQERHEPIEPITVVEELRRTEELEQAGGAAYIASLTDGLPRVTNVEHYAKIVKKKALLRSAIHLAHRIQQSAMDMPDSVEGVLDSAVDGFLELALEGALPNDDGKTYKDAAISLLKSFEKEDKIRVMSGLTVLDKQTGGFRENELVTITAGTGVGKTLLAQQIRRRACESGLQSLYCSAEMTAEHLVSREIATTAEVDHRLMRRPEKLTKEEYQALLNAAMHECPKCKILDGELSLQRIRITARRKKRSTGLDLLILDYDELIDAPGKTELDQQRNLIRGAKRIATELAVPVIVISQLRKALDSDEAKRPSLDRIYGGGSKSKHSSWIFFVDREYVRELKGDQTVGRICILKARDGRVCEIPVSFNIKTLRFEDAYNPVTVEDA